MYKGHPPSSDREKGDMYDVFPNNYPHHHPSADLAALDAFSFRSSEFERCYGMHHVSWTLSRYVATRDYGIVRKDGPPTHLSLPSH